ncbi:MAG: hypothetical protein AB7O96_00840 [Pseudobdellovibrionaceae bacterium]
MKKLIPLILLTAISCGGNSNDLGIDPNAAANCDFQISDFTNGDTSQNASSQWNCQSNGQSFAFQIFDDGTGYSTAGGAFTWSQTGCTDIELESSVATEKVSNINGSIQSGIITFKDSALGVTANVSCVLSQ